MRVWRICRRAHAADPLGGRGGLYFSGRWHPRGIRIVYASATLSLAALELLVHVDRDLLWANLVQIEIDLPDELQVKWIEARTLPSHGRRHPAPAALQRIGASWIEQGKTAVLRVPSAVIPDEDNYLLNPAHPAIERIKVIGRRAHAADSLGGRGGLHFSGRWHLQGIRIVYTSATLSLAALELLVHVDRDLLPSDLVQFEIDLPDDLQVERIEARTLPSHWRRYPAPAALQRIGAGWIEQGKTAILRVPSAVIPDEDNYLLNPAHPAIERIKVVGRRAFNLDPRLGR